MIDRIVGAVVFMISVSAFWVARGYEAGFGDPLGPAVFPQMVAALAAKKIRRMLGSPSRGTNASERARRCPRHLLSRRQGSR